MKEACCGDIVAVGKMDWKTGDTVCDPKNEVELPPIELAEPCYSMAIAPKTKGQDDKVAAGLARLNEEDISFTLVNNGETHQMVISGAGAAAISVCKLLLSAGVLDVTLCDRQGAIYAGRGGLNWIKEEMAAVTNLCRQSGSLADVLVGADVLIGVSRPGMVTREMVQTMNRDAIIFACANPTPEIFPDEAKAGGASVVSTGRSDYPNQINNVLAFPGIFRGAFDVRASDINEEMKMAAAQALAGLISEEELCADYIIPKAFDPRVGPAVAAAVAQAARDSGVARI